MLPGAFDTFGKTIMFVGGILLLVGALIHFGGKFISLGRLPGDLQFQKENFTFYFPIATSILLSIILTIVLNVFFRR